MLRSSSGLGHSPFTRATRVRVPYGVPNIGDKCYGSTTGSNPVSVGSTPTSSANYYKLMDVLFAANGSLYVTVYGVSSLKII